MVILKNYNFLKPLVKKGQADRTAPFKKNGFCLADKRRKPNHVFVFHFDNGYIWITYAWTKSKNKSFYKFVKKLESIIFKFNMPILRMGANEDIHNHTRKCGMIDNIAVFQYLGAK